MIGAFLDHLWQSTLIGLAAAGVAVLLRNYNANARYWLWFAASVKFLLPFSLLVAVGTHLRLPADPIVTAPPAMFLMEQIAQPFSSEVPIVAVRDSGFRWSPVLIAIWAVGCSVVLLVQAQRWRRIAGALRRAKPFNVVAPLPVMVSTSQLEPGLVGIWRPILLMPEGIAKRLSKAEMQAIVAHELCHLRRRDNLTGAIHVLVQTVYWFHPMVWWMGVKMVAERERACDDGVVERGHDPQTYAEGILKVCKFYAQSPIVWAAGVSGADLRQRVETIMANRRSVALSTTKAGLLVLTGVALLAVPVGAGLASGSFVRERTVIPSDRQVTRNLSAQAQPRVAVPFDPANFDRYVGYYNAHVLITVTREGDRFFATRMTPALKLEIFPESDKKFFAKTAVAQFSFVTDTMARVTELIYHQSGVQRRFKRIDEREARAIETALVERVRANTPSPGTERALRRYILGLASGRPNYDELALGIAVRVRWTLEAVETRVRSFGALKSLTFKGVTPDGLEIYHADMENRQVEWRIAPLTADGKVTWVDNDVMP